MMAVKIEAVPVFLFIIGLCSVVTLVLGALAWSRTSSFLLPLPAWLPVVVTLLSPLTTIAIVTGKIFNRHTTNAPNVLRSRIVSIVDQLHSVLLTAIATVALTYLFPDNILSCHLEQQWQSYFQAKDTQTIRAIQDGFQCCGLRSIHDRAWPFKDRNHGDNACEVQLGYHQSCLVPWSGQQQVASWMVFAAAVLSWAVKIGLIHISYRRPSWMSTASSSSRGDYQRITHPELEDEEGRAGGEEAGTRRTMLPHSGPALSNAWEDEF